MTTKWRKKKKMSMKFFYKNLLFFFNFENSLEFILRKTNHLQMSLLIIMDRNRKTIIYTYSLSLILILVFLLVDELVMLIVLDKDHRITNFSYVQQHLVLSYECPRNILLTYDATKMIFLHLNIRLFVFFSSIRQFCLLSNINKSKHKIATYKGTNTTLNTDGRTLFSPTLFLSFILLISLLH